MKRIIPFFFSFSFLLLFLGTELSFYPGDTDLRINDEQGAASSFVEQSPDFFCEASGYRFAFGKEERTFSTSSGDKNNSKVVASFQQPATINVRLNGQYNFSFSSLPGYQYPFYILFHRLLL